MKQRDLSDGQRGRQQQVFSLAWIRQGQNGGQSLRVQQYSGEEAIEGTPGQRDSRGAGESPCYEDTFCSRHSSGSGELGFGLCPSVRDSGTSGREACVLLMRIP